MNAHTYVYIYIHIHIHLTLEQYELELAVSNLYMNFLQQQIIHHYMILGWLKLWMQNLRYEKAVYGSPTASYTQISNCAENSSAPNLFVQGSVVCVCEQRERERLLMSIFISNRACVLNCPHLPTCIWVRGISREENIN